MSFRITPISEDDARLLATNPGAISSVQEVEASVDLDQSWHGLHFLLAGDGGDLPAATLLCGGRSIGDPENGVRLLLPEEIRAFQAYVGELSETAVVARYEQGQQDDILANDIEYLLHYFRVLKGALGRMVDAERGAIFSLD